MSSIIIPVVPYGETGIKESIALAVVIFGMEPGLTFAMPGRERSASRDARALPPRAEARRRNRREAAHRRALKRRVRAAGIFASDDVHLDDRIRIAYDLERDGSRIERQMFDGSDDDGSAFPAEPRE